MFGDYEEANWAKLSPKFRDTHNKLRVARGMPTLSPPKVDLYVPPPPTPIRTFDPSDPEFIAAAREFSGGALTGAFAQGEGFQINGRNVSFALNDIERAEGQVMRERIFAQQRQRNQGFKINGRSA